MGAGWLGGYEDPTNSLARHHISMKKKLKLMSYNVKGQKNMNTAFIKHYEDHFKEERLQSGDK